MRTLWTSLVRAEDNSQGTQLVLQVPKQIGRQLDLRRIREIEIGYEDGRYISPAQRRKIYATLRDISNHTGYDPESAKQVMKIEHMERTGRMEWFSLSDCSVTTAREFINTLMDYALKEGIILTDTGLQRTDDIDTYLIQCIKYRRCCICGRKADLHHVDAIGMGRDRRRVDDSQSEVMALCREHHTVFHTLGLGRFMKMYAVYGIARYRAEAYGAGAEEGR